MTRPAKWYDWAVRVRTFVLVAAVSVVCSACGAGPDSSSPDDRSLTLTEYVGTVEEMEPPGRSVEDSEDVMRERLRWDDSTPFASLPASASEACTSALAFLDQRESGAQDSGDSLWDREREAEKLIAALSTRPDFFAASTSHQEAIVDGIRAAAAAAGKC